MTARKPKSAPETVAETTHAAEHEQDVVSKAKPSARVTAEQIAQDISGDYAKAEANGNRVTITIEGPNGLVQTFHATVEEGIREF